MKHDGHDEVAREIGALFGFGEKKRPPRAKPHRCLGCGKVTRHVFCPSTYAECRARYHERQGR